MGVNVDDISKRVVPWLLRHRRAVLRITLAATLVGSFFAVRLYSDLRSELEELLPRNAPSVVAARTLAPKLHSIAKLVVDIEGTDPDAIERFIDALVPRLEALPKDLVARVRFRADQEENFLQQYGGLYLTIDELLRLRDQIAARKEWERNRANPIGLESESELGPPPEVDVDSLEDKYKKNLGTTAEFRKGYLQTPDGKHAIIEIRQPQAVLGLRKNRELMDAVKAAVAAVNPHSYDPTMRVGYSGDVTELVEEQEALVSDLASSTIVVVVGVLFVLWFYYRRWLAVLAVLGPLTAGSAVTFGLSDFLVGHLNANTAFLGSIVLGNGINPAIIVVARYLEERRRGYVSDEAVRQAWVATMPATFVASFGAGLAYLSLAVTDFRGFNQFGVIGGLGMALCWLAAYVVGPPLLGALEAARGFKLTEQRERPIASAVARWVLAHTTLLRVATVVAVVGSFVAIITFRGNHVEYDWTRVRSKRAVKQGSVHWAHIEDDVWRSYLTPVVLWSPDAAALQRAVDNIEAGRRRLGPDDPIQSIRTVENSIPSDQLEKLPVLETIRDQLTPSLLKKLPPDLRKKAERFRPPGEIRPVTFADLPESWRSALSERNGTIGHVAAVFPKPILETNMRDVYDLKHFIRGAVAEADDNVMIYSQVFLMSDINEAIYRDGPKATIMAFVLVCFLVVLVFRSVRPSLQVIASLALGVFVLVGIGAAFRVRINFLNFVVLPISFGIGVDYAMNIIQRYRTEGAGALQRVLSETGGAVALCSSTTVVGYGSLWVADSQALSGFGILAALGEITCLSAALVLLPAWLRRQSITALRAAPNQTEAASDSSGHLAARARSANGDPSHAPYGPPDR